MRNQQKMKNIRENLSVWIAAYSSIVVATISLSISWKSYRLSQLQNYPQVRVRYVDVDPKGIGATFRRVDILLREATRRDMAILENSVFKRANGFRRPSYTRFLLLENVGKLYIARLRLKGHEMLYDSTSSNISEFISGRDFAVDVPGGLKPDELIAVPLAVCDDNFKFSARSPTIEVGSGTTATMLSVREIICKCESGQQTAIPVREKLETTLHIMNLEVGM